MRFLILAQWNWQGPARIPAALKAIGCEVAMICQKGELASLTRHVDKFVYVNVSDEAQVLDALDRTIREWHPDIILPGTDNMVSTFQKYRHSVEAGGVHLDESLKQAVFTSSFAKEAEKYVFSKIDLLEALKDRGVQIAPQAEIHTLGNADLFVQEHGYPVLLKPDIGFAGVGIHFCHTEEELLEALQKVLFGNERARYCIQKYLGKKTALIEFAAKDGKMLAANAVSRLRTYPGDTGPTSVAKVVAGKRMREAAEQMCELLGYNGIGVAQFMVTDEDCEDASFIELNPRMSSFIHLWRTLGTDLCQALVRAWSDKRVTIEPTRVGLTMALYPQECLRDKDSEFLLGLRDRVEDDPALAAEYERVIAKRWMEADSKGL